MSDPLLLAVVSGKGGVGKTMLAVAIANEMAQGRRTLLVDLDFFNRGLTGLFASLVGRSPQRTLVPPTGLVRAVDDSDWLVARVSDSLFVLSYGDVDKTSSTALEEMDVTVLAQHLRQYIGYVCELTGCEVALLDCHGGPDNTSFAACMIARHSILVSEPDKITLYGTLNFLRTLHAVIPEPRPDVRLVFNKVIPAFSARFLFRFYRQFLAGEFAPHDLLAVYPIEPHLTKAFEKTPFLTTVYPTAQLAEKTRLLLHNLLAASQPALLPAAIRHQSRTGRWLRTYYLGRWPRLLDVDVIMRIIAIVAIFFWAAPELAAAAAESYPSVILTRLAALKDIKIDNGDLSAQSVGTAFVWLIVAVLLRWARDLDVFATYGMRTRSWGRALPGCLVLLGFGLIWGVALGAIAARLNPHTSVLDLWLGIPLVAGLMIPLLWYAKRGVREVWHERRFAEGTYRLTASLVLPGLGALAAVLSAPPPAP